MGSLAPSLLHHLTAPDTAVPCAFGLGVCAEKGEAIFSPFVPMAVPALLGLLSRGGVSAQMDPDLALTLQDNVFSSLLKICVFQGHVLDGGADIAVAGGAQPTSSNLLKLVLDNMPLKGDPYEARALHHLFVSLMQARDVRLLGGRADCVVQVCACVLIIYCCSSFCYSVAKFIGYIYIRYIDYLTGLSLRYILLPMCYRLSVC